MIEFILNKTDIKTELPAGMTVLDFVRYRQNLKGTKIGCREGDCGACTVLVGELMGGGVDYRAMTSCLMPVANAAGKHIVSVEGINPDDGSLTPVQQAMVHQNGTQCGFCTVGFVMSLTGFCVDETKKTSEMAISAVDGNICRCTGYKSIERAAAMISEQLSAVVNQNDLIEKLEHAIESRIVPSYFEGIGDRLIEIRERNEQPKVESRPQSFVGGGTDVYVQRPDEIADAESTHLFYDESLRGIRDTGEFIEMGASTTVTDLLVSPVMKGIFPNLYNHLKLISSTPIRNMATLAGNFVNASPIGDMTVWFLGLDAEIVLGTNVAMPAVPQGNLTAERVMPLRDLYLGYKRLAKTESEFITAIRFRKPVGDFRFNFEKVCKRTYLDIATVNTAISLKCSRPMPGPTSAPSFIKSELENAAGSHTAYVIEDVHLSAGGVSPIPLYLKETSAFLRGKEISAETVAAANDIIQSEVSPISDVRGTERYKRLLLRQLFKAHFIELFEI
ncbi:MAG: 2Fe-2S iron-sulfur cluster-binding protein [Acidobacteriota bacterium]